MNYTLLILVFCLNSWFLGIIRYDFKVSIILLLATLLSYCYIFTLKSSRLITIFFIIFSINLYLAVGVIGIDKNLFSFASEQISQLNQRRSYYPETIGKIFQNKLTLSLDKILDNLFVSLDWNLYFFNGHPREQVKIDKSVSLPFILLPFFLIGTYNLVTNKYKRFLSLALVVLVFDLFIDTNFRYGPLLNFSILNVVIVTGLICSKPFAQRVYRKIAKV